MFNRARKIRLRDRQGAKLVNQTRHIMPDAHLCIWDFGPNVMVLPCALRQVNIPAALCQR